MPEAKRLKVRGEKQRDWRLDVKRACLSAPFEGVMMRSLACLFASFYVDERRKKASPSRVLANSNIADGQA